jgi:hypothetical protein
MGRFFELFINKKMAIIIEKKRNSYLNGLNIELSNHIFPTARTFYVKKGSDEHLIIGCKIWDEHNIFGTNGRTHMCVFYYDKIGDEFVYSDSDCSWKVINRAEDNYADTFMFFCDKTKPSPELLLRIYQKFILRHFFSEKEIKYHQTDSNIFKLGHAIVLENELRELMKNTMYRIKALEKR